MIAKISFNCILYQVFDKFLSEAETLKKDQL